MRYIKALAFRISWSADREKLAVCSHLVTKTDRTPSNRALPYRKCYQNVYHYLSTNSPFCDSCVDRDSREFCCRIPYHWIVYTLYSLSHESTRIYTTFTKFHVGITSSEAAWQRRYRSQCRKHIIVKRPRATIHSHSFGYKLTLKHGDCERLYSVSQ